MYLVQMSRSERVGRSRVDMVEYGLHCRLAFELSDFFISQHEPLAVLPPRSEALMPVALDMGDVAALDGVNCFD